MDNSSFPWPWRTIKDIKDTPAEKRFFTISILSSRVLHEKKKSLLSLNSLRKIDSYETRWNFVIIMQQINWIDINDDSWNIVIRTFQTILKRSTYFLQLRQHREYTGFYHYGISWRTDFYHSLIIKSF